MKFLEPFIAFLFLFTVCYIIFDISNVSNKTEISIGAGVGIALGYILWNIILKLIRKIIDYFYKRQDEFVNKYYEENKKN